MKYILFFLLFSVCLQAQTTVLAPYAESKSAPIKLNPGDTLVTAIPGYFINPLRYDMYRKLHSAAADDPVLFESVVNDFSDYVIEQDAILDELKSSINRVDQAAIDLRAGAFDAAILAQDNQRLAFSLQQEKIDKLEASLKEAQKKPKWPWLALPASFLAGYLIAR